MIYLILSWTRITSLLAKRLIWHVEHLLLLHLRFELLQLLQILINVVVVILWIVLALIFVVLFLSSITVWPIFACWYVIQVKVLIVNDLPRVSLAILVIIFSIQVLKLIMELPEALFIVSVHIKV